MKNRNESFMKKFMKSVETTDDVKSPWKNIKDEEPKLKVGDSGYQGYLVIANGQVYVADWTFDKYGSGPEFYVDGEYEPDVTYWTEIPSLDI